VLIGIITSAVTIVRLPELAAWFSRYIDNVVVIVDLSVPIQIIDQIRKNYPIRFFQANCSADYRVGLACRTKYFFEVMPILFPEVQWFLRVVDDVYVHVENLMLYVASLNETKPMTIAQRLIRNHPSPFVWYDRFWQEGEYIFPAGSSWLVNRAFLSQNVTLVVNVNNTQQNSTYETISSVNETIHQSNVTITTNWMQLWEDIIANETAIDDVAWGKLCDKMGIPLTPNGGFMHFPPNKAACAPWYICADVRSMPELIVDTYPIAFHMFSIHMAQIPALHEHLSSFHFKVIPFDPSRKEFYFTYQSINTKLIIEKNIDMYSLYDMECVYCEAMIHEQ